MASQNSFNTRTPITVGGDTLDIFSLPALEKAGFPERRAAAVLAEDPAREPAAPRGRAVRRSGRHPGAGRLGCPFGRAEGDRLHAGAGAAPGLHRRAGGCRPGGDARRHRQARRRSDARSTRCSRSNSSSTTPCRSTTIVERNAADLNAALEFGRNRERYTFLRWGQEAFDNFRVVPPDTGIVHQVNLEYLARVVFRETADGKALAYPDTLVGTDSHTTMVNGLGVVGWGVGGIEAEAAMLGQPISMLIPEVVGFRLVGRLPEGATATDLVLTITERLRKQGVVGKFVEFYGPGLEFLTIADRATLGNMSPGVRRDDRDLPDRRDDARLPAPDEPRRGHVALVEAYAKEQGLFRSADGAGSGLHDDDRARSLDRRAEPRRAEAAAGPRLADARRR